MHQRWLARLSSVVAVAVAGLTLAGRGTAGDFHVTDQPGLRWWVSGESLLWWSKPAPSGATVTTGPTRLLGPGQRPGTLGLPGTQVLVGDTPLGFGPAPGGRFSAGLWLDEFRTFGVEAGYLFLGRSSAGRTASQPGTPGTPPLSIPFFDVLRGRENSTGIAFPRAVNAFGGSYDLTTSTRLQGAELNGLARVAECPGLRVELLAGFRYLSLDEALRFDTVSINTPPLRPDVFETFDRFETDNDFYGGQLGTRVEYSRGAWFVQGCGKVALGGMHQTTRINGLLRTNDFTNLGPVQSFRGGYLALPTNSGEFDRDHFAVVPEGSVRIGWRPSERLRLSIGYSIIYASSVARPGDQVDRVVNPTQAPAYLSDPNARLRGPAFPAFPDRDADFWAHGLSFGLELRF